MGDDAIPDGDRFLVQARDAGGRWSTCALIGDHPAGLTSEQADRRAAAMTESRVVPVNEFRVERAEPGHSMIWGGPPVEPGQPFRIGVHREA